MINISKKNLGRWSQWNGGKCNSSKLVKEGCNVIKASKKELNLVNQEETNSWIKNKNQK